MEVLELENKLLQYQIVSIIYKLYLTYRKKKKKNMTKKLKKCRMN